MTVTTAFCDDLNYRSITNASILKLSFGFMAKWDRVITFFNEGRIAAAEKSPLSYYTPQSVHGHSYCSVRNFPLTMDYGGKKIGENRGRVGQILTPNERVLTYGVLVYDVKFHHNWVRIATVGEVTDRQKDRQTDTDGSNFIICPMLCYSNGTDKNL